MRTLLPALLALLLPRGAPAPPSGGQGSRTIGEVYTRGEESTWVIEQEGIRLGHCTSRYEGEVRLGFLRAHRFRERVLLEVARPTGNLEQRFTNDLVTDAHGHPLSFDFRTQAGDLKAGVEARLYDGRAEMRVGQGGSRRPMTLDLPSSVFLLANNFISELELLLALDLPDSAKAEWTLLSANALRTFSFSVEPGDQPGFLADSLGERLQFEDRRLVRVEIPAQKIVIRRVEQRFEPFTIELEERQRPDDLDHEDVGLTDGEVHLAGTLTKPKGADGRLPAVFFLSGSGGQDRDGFFQGTLVPARAWLASHLDRDPLVVLRRVPCPVLVLQGGRDVQVSAERDAPRLLAALEEVQHVGHELRLFPELDHFFMRPSGAGVNPLDLLKSRPVDPEFLEALRGWIVARLAP